MTMMKLIKGNPKLLFSSNKKKKNTRSVSLSNPPSFGSVASSSSSEESLSSATDLKPGGDGTAGIRRTRSEEITVDWSDSTTADIHFELVQAFKFIDKDGDGKITRQELETLLTRVTTEPLNEEELSMMLKEVDRDGDGCISLEEFAAISSVFGPACGSELREAFDIFDADKDGKISAEELLGVFMAIGDDRCSLQDCRRMIGGVDKDGDGFVCFEEFSQMMQRQR